MQSQRDFVGIDLHRELVETRAALCREIAARLRSAVPRALHDSREDRLAALAVFWIVFFASVPATLPLLFVREAWLALRDSNLLLLALLFFIGHRLPTHIRINLSKPAVGCTPGGVALVVIAVGG